MSYAGTGPQSCCFPLSSSTDATHTLAAPKHACLQRCTWHCSWRYARHFTCSSNDQGRRKCCYVEMYEHTGLLCHAKYLQKPERGDVCSTSRASFQSGPLLWSLCDNGCWSEALVSCLILGPCCQFAISFPTARPVTVTVAVSCRPVVSATSSSVSLTAAMLASIAVFPTVIPAPVPEQSSGFRQLRGWPGLLGDRQRM